MGAAPGKVAKGAKSAFVSVPSAFSTPASAPSTSKGTGCSSAKTGLRETAGGGPGATRKMRPACRHGLRCENESEEHRAQFSHPGDQDYRKGWVKFEASQKPEFETLWQVFSFYDEFASGHLTKENFELSLQQIGSVTSAEATAAWAQITAGAEDSVTFLRFAAFVEQYGCHMPIGIGGQQEAEQPMRQQLLGPVPAEWSTDVSGLVSGLVDVHDPGILEEFQILLDATHKETDNWTRDRGCSKHGVNACEGDCVYKNRAPVPAGYRIVAVQRNQNRALWSRYSLMRAAIQEECNRASAAVATGTAKSSKAPPPAFAVEVTKEDSETSFLHSGFGAPPVLTDLNEWRLFHGSSRESLEAICQRNFNVSLAGTGATWRKAGESKGEPLYGQGLYFSERITKADEYAKPFPAGPDAEGKQRFIFSVLVCRVIGGRVQLCTKNNIDKAFLRQQVFRGPHHSVLGDREKELKKPYREFVIYDKDQVFPEFLVTYARIFPGESYIPIAPVCPPAPAKAPPPAAALPAGGGGKATEGGARGPSKGPSSRGDSPSEGPSGAPTRRLLPAEIRGGRGPFTSETSPASGRGAMSREASAARGGADRLGGAMGRETSAPRKMESAVSSRSRTAETYDAGDRAGSPGTAAKTKPSRDRGVSAPPQRPKHDLSGLAAAIPPDLSEKSPGFSPPARVSYYSDRERRTFMYLLHIAKVSARPSTEWVLPENEQVVCRWYVDKAHDSCKPFRWNTSESCHLGHYSYLVLSFPDTDSRDQKLTLTISQAKGEHLAVARLNLQDVSTMERQEDWKLVRAVFKASTGAPVADATLHIASQARWGLEAIKAVEEAAFVSPHGDAQAKYLSEHFSGSKASR